MKKELNELLAVSAERKTLGINGAFILEAFPVSAYGEPVTVYRAAQPARMALRLSYTLVHDKLTGDSVALDGQTPEALIPEIREKMADMLARHAEALLREWDAGYIQGPVRKEEIGK